MYEDDAYVVLFGSRSAGITKKLYYCNTDKEPYDTIDCSLFGGIKFYKEMEVSPDGTPIGYQQIKETNKTKN